MKKSISLILAAMLMLSLAACNGKAADGDKTSEPASTVSDTLDSPDDSQENPTTNTDNDAETSTSTRGGIMRYGISIPADFPEFDESFYEQDADAYTDDVLAENREKLNAVPFSTHTEVLNRFTDYLNTVEPGENTGSVQMIWFYVTAFEGKDDKYNVLTQIPVPLFEGGETEMSPFSLPGSVQGLFINNASYAPGEDANGAEIFVNIYTDSDMYETAKRALDAHEQYMSEREQDLYANYDEAEKTCTYFVHSVSDEDDMFESYRTCGVFQTIAEGHGYDGNDILLVIDIDLASEPKLKDEDVAVIRDYFEYLGVQFPDDAAWNIG